ncbi:unnamed protein product [Phyllotreta striolata]|uniref:Protein krueppel n=1 Tax=Phyllotreta striolata TaxID=444603 RepID=A0A9N9TFB1_PHYSR|nr:unnamed protein product [Phyllotreta striolata]
MEAPTPKNIVIVRTYDFSKICRICLLPNVLLPLEATYIDIFERITNLKLDNDRKMPGNICEVCVKVLEDIEQFIRISTYKHDLLLRITNSRTAVNNKIHKSRTAEINESSLEQSSDTKDDLLLKINNPETAGIDELSLEQSSDSKDGLLLKINNPETAGNDELSLGQSSDHKVDDEGNNKSKVAVKVKKVKNTSCTECNRTFRCTTTLARHMRTHTGDKPYKCSYCDKTFAIPGSLKTHTRIHTGITPYVCTICNKRYTSISGLKKHKIKMHLDADEADRITNTNKSAKIKCQYCEKLVNPQGYGTHLRVHKEKKIKIFVCQYCSKTFSRQSRLDRHVRIHTGERPFVCTTCGKSFRQDTDLSRHVDSHSDKKNYQCQHCGKMYYTKPSLYTHIITSHFPKRKYKTNTTSYTKRYRRNVLCTICGKSFSSMGSLKVHGRLHDGEYPFACTACDKRYTNGSNLKRHIARNHGTGKHHVCLECDKSFYERSDLNRHVKNLHSDTIRYEVLTGSKDSLA